MDLYWKSRSRKSELEGEPPAEGAVVTVLIREDDESFIVPADQEQKLLAAIEEAEQDLLIDGADLIRDLR